MPNLHQSNFFFLSVFFLGLVTSGGCQHRKGAILNETPLNLSETRVVVVKVIGQPRFVSENGRELSSKYYDEFGNSEEVNDNPSERFYSHISILGDRRPYDILVEVRVEKKKGNKYIYLANDKEMEKSLSNKIKQALHQSMDKRNLIDDFRPY